MKQAGPRIVLKPGREKSLKHRHPWVFSGAVERVDGTPAAGDTIPIVSSETAFLGWGAYSPTSQIRARAWSAGRSLISCGPSSAARGYAYRLRCWTATRIERSYVLGGFRSNRGDSCCFGRVASPATARTRRARSPR